MIVQGDALIETSIEKERIFFEDLYEITVPDLIKDYELTRFEIDPKIKAFAFMEYDMEAVKIIRLQEGDKAVVFGEGCYNLPFNTCGMAVLEVYSAAGFNHQWVVENSPYQMQEDDCEFEEAGKYPEDIIAYEPILNGLEPDEVIFVRQL